MIKIIIRNHRLRLIFITPFSYPCSLSEGGRNKGPGSIYYPFGGRIVLQGDKSGRFQGPLNLPVSFQLREDKG
jgi:hypothetical protein